MSITTPLTFPDSLISLNTITICDDDTLRDPKSPVTSGSVNNNGNLPTASEISSPQATVVVAKKNYNSKIRIITRTGTTEEFSYDQILTRIGELTYGMNMEYVEPIVIAGKVTGDICNGITTMQIDQLSADICSNMVGIHHHHSLLGGRILMSALHKRTSASFEEVTEKMYSYIDDETGKPAPKLSDMYVLFVRQHYDKIQSALDFSKDMDYEYSAVITLLNSYLFKIDGRTVERPQHALMRIACCLYSKVENIDKALNLYSFFAKRLLSPSTPTWFNAGTPRSQCSACFIFAPIPDSIDGQYQTLKDVALTSKEAGGIGLSANQIRGQNSNIRGTQGKSNGVTPLFRVFNETARYVDQCTYAHTLVMTSNGWMPIGRIVSGELVMNHLGQFDMVDTVLRHKVTNQTMINFDIGLREDEYVSWTPEHQILIMRDEQTEVKLTQEQTWERIQNGLIKPCMKDAKDIKVGDLITIPVPKGDSRFRMANDSIEMFGAIYQRGTPEQDNYYAIDFDKEENDDDGWLALRHAEDYLEARAIPFESKTPIGKTNTFTLEWNGNHPAFHFNPSNFTEAAPTFIRQMNVDQLRIFFKAYKKDIKVSDITLGLLPYYLKSLGAGLHADHGIYIFNDVAYVPIKDTSKDEYPYDGVLYDLEVQGEHTYVTSMGAVHNGGGKRKGAFAIYLEPWHCEIFTYLNLKKGHGNQELKARDLHYAIWNNNFFMEQVRKDGDWWLMSPSECPGLDDVYDQEFVDLYMSYVAKGEKKGYRSKIKARDLFSAVCVALRETGEPYVSNKDESNRKSEQKNLGRIYSHNLCNEVSLVAFHDEEDPSKSETGVCNLMAVVLSNHYDHVNKKIDFDLIRESSAVANDALDHLIDINYSPIPSAARSNQQNRPVGVGDCGYADLLFLARAPFDSWEAYQLNDLIFEDIYRGSILNSIKNAKELGAYPSIDKIGRDGKPAPCRQGIFQFDAWGAYPASGRYDWEQTREDMKKYGLRNSQLTCCMPTAGTAQLNGVYEGNDPQQACIFTRKVNKAQFIVINRYMQEDLINLGLWDKNKEMYYKIVVAGGSIQPFPEIPDHIKKLYRCAPEIPFRPIIKNNARRSLYVTMSQSFNITLENKAESTITEFLFESHDAKLKTNVYYLRSGATAKPQNFAIPLRIENEVVELMKKHDARKASIRKIVKEKKRQHLIKIGKILDSNKTNSQQEEEEDSQAFCSIDNPEACMSCGS